MKKRETKGSTPPGAYNTIARLQYGEDGKPEPTKDCIITVEGARAIYNKLRANHIKRIYLYAEIDAMISGNPPYNREELAAANLTHISNFNTQEPRSLYKKAVQVYHNLLYSSKSVVNIELDYPFPEVPKIAKTLSKHWSEVIRKKWRSFNINMAVLSSQLVEFGISPLVWSDDVSPFWRSVELSKFFIPDQSQSDIDLLSIIGVENEFSIIHLFRIWQEYKNDKEATHWNVDALEKLLLFFGNTKQQDNNNVHDVLELEAKVAQGDLAWDRLYNETIRLVSFFYKQDDGKVTHKIFSRTQTEYGANEFLYEFNSDNENLSDFILIYTLSPGERYIHGNRGLGQEIFSMAQAKMMLDNSLIDMARWSSTPILKGPTSTVKDPSPLRFYPGVPTDIGGSEFVHNNLGDNLQGVIATSQYVDGLQQRNIAFSGEDSGQPDAALGSQSPTAERLKAFREFGVLKINVNHFYDTADRMFEQMTIRLLQLEEGDDGYELKKLWMERCINDGVPEELFKAEKGSLPKNWRVSATRAGGAGSQVAQIIALQELAPIAGSFGRREQQAYTEDWIEATVGSEYIERYTQDSKSVDEVSGGASLAGVENLLMQDGKMPLFSLDNDQRGHAGVHTSLGIDTIKAITAGQLDVVQGDRILSVLVPHLGEHVKALGMNPFAKEAFGQYEQAFKQIVSYAEHNHANAIKALKAQEEKQQQDQLETQKVLNEEERKNVKSQGDERRADEKVQGQVTRAAEADKRRGDALRRKTDTDIQTKERLTEAQVNAINSKATPANKPIEQTDAEATLGDIINKAPVSPFNVRP